MNKEQIINLINEFRDSFLPDKWKWRRGQKEAIIEIILAYYNGVKTVILDAPVGSGKSIIAICSSWILNQQKKTSYILASDIALQEQYEKDIKKIHFTWGSVKGIRNYMCVDNMEKSSMGTCRIRNTSPKKMYCYSSCPYFSARDNASESPTAVLNYAYWLIMQNYVNEHTEEDKQLFPERDITFCDEAHKILDIVQNHYSPKFDDKTLDKLEKLKDFFKTYHLEDHSRDFQSLKILVKGLFDIENQDKLFRILKKIEIYLENYKETIDVFKEQVNKEYSKTSPPKEWYDALRISDWLNDFHCKIEDYVYIIDKTSTRNLIKNPSNDKEIVFNCLEENYMMNKYFHEHTGFTVLMSATFANPRDYIQSIGLTNAKVIKVESNFNFDKSPIYFYNKRKMSYSQMESNLPWLYNKIDEILEKHPKENGIIHTASYNLTMNIHNNLSHKNKQRILIYEGTEEKRKVLKILKRNKGKVLMGPSITEGLDLFGDLSRFAIFAKVPYLSLGDKFVKTKMQINPKWYAWAAIINILQGTGRSIRSETDWASTYMLDGSLGDLIHRNRGSFPNDFMKRIIVMPD